MNDLEVTVSTSRDGSAVRVGTELFRLDGKVAIVTGGGGTLGTAMAHGLARAGASVLVADLSQQAAESTASEIVMGGGQALAAQVDVIDRDAVEATVQKAVITWGRLDILINSHGISSRGSAVDYDQDLFERVVGVNLTGTFLFCQAAARVMLAAGDGRIVNIASIAGLIGYQGNPAYLSSKGGVVQLTRALAMEWATKGVRVNAIAPGVIATPIVAKQVEKEPAFYVEFQKKHPMDRFGRPDELVGPALFLCSDASSYVTGHILAVDGGYTAA